MATPTSDATHGKVMGIPAHKGGRFRTTQTSSRQENPTGQKSVLRTTNPQTTYSKPGRQKRRNTKSVIVTGGFHATRWRAGRKGLASSARMYRFEQSCPKDYGGILPPSGTADTLFHVARGPVSQKRPHPRSPLKARHISKDWNHTK